MSPSNGRPDDQRQFVREVMGEIEAMRLKRQAEWREGNHPYGKRFTQEEVASEVYGAYKNMALGRTRRIPLRHDLLRIADYLECTIHETNDLLIVAQYLPEVVELREDEQRAALEQAQTLLHMLPFPAYVVTQLWNIDAANNLYCKFYNFSSLARFSSNERTIFHLTLNQSSPIRQMQPDTITLHTNVRRLISLLDPSPRWKREQWYINQLRQFKSLDGFEKLWNTEPQQQEVDINKQFRHVSLDGTTFNVQGFTVAAISMDAPLAPIIVGVLPKDDAAYRVFAELGCPVTENRWEHALTLGGAP